MRAPATLAGDLLLYHISAGQYPPAGHGGTSGAACSRTSQSRLRSSEATFQERETPYSARATRSSGSRFQPAATSCGTLVRADSRVIFKVPASLASCFTPSMRRVHAQVFAVGAARANGLGAAELPPKNLRKGSQCPVRRHVSISQHLLHAEELRVERLRVLRRDAQALQVEFLPLFGDRVGLVEELAELDLAEVALRGGVRGDRR